MKKQGIVIHNDVNYEYKLDNNRYVWIKKGSSWINLGQVAPLHPGADIESFVHQMLVGGGY